jgi:hypothetical protein
MCDAFQTALKKCARELETTPGYPIWIDGFSNTVLRGHTAHDDDNSYDRFHEPKQHREYRAGALAARSLLRAVISGWRARMPQVRRARHGNV